MLPYHRALYQDAIARARYYVWSAKGFPRLPGNDPITGRPRKQGLGTYHDQMAIAEARAAYKAMAKVWLDHARKIRLERSSVLSLSRIL